MRSAGAFRRAKLQDPVFLRTALRLWLVVMLEARRTDLKKLSERLARDAFFLLPSASPSCSVRCSAIAPGSVTPFLGDHRQMRNRPSGRRPVL